MDRRRFLTGAAATASAALAQSAKIRPNILYLHSHDTGRFLQPYGHAVPTPNLQKLAEGGMLFRQAFNAAPTCSPSRASLLTGCCPHSNGMLGLVNRGFVMPDYSKHLVHTLRAAGYSSALLGLQHVARDPNIIGFDKVVRPKSTRVEDVTPVALDFLNHAPKQPFFIDVGFFETHRPFRGAPAEESRYCFAAPPLPDTAQTRQDIANFKHSALALDNAMGEILKALETNGLASNTLVISTTDHGIAFPDMKCNLFDFGMGVSLILRGPGGFSAGKVCDAMVSHIDVFPTLCELLDIERPAWLEGKSMLPAVRGEKTEINDQIFAEVNYHAAYEPKRAVRTKRYKYIKHYDGRVHPNLPNCDDGLSKSLWMEHGWKNRVVAAEQLYDLMFDPHERRNVAYDSALQPVLAEMRGRLARWMHATKDPLLDGPVKPQPGATANDPDGNSPNEPVRKLA
jgi:N-sulfoglucosamine sulfohydrolase